MSKTETGPSTGLNNTLSHSVRTSSLSVCQQTQHLSSFTLVMFQTPDFDSNLITLRGVIRLYSAVLGCFFNLCFVSETLNKAAVIKAHVCFNENTSGSCSE